MNILYLTHITTKGWTGPRYSVPMQIKHQAKYDNVFWYQLNEDYKEEWREYCSFISIKDYPKTKISLLPEPFNKPDLIIVEQFYGYFKNLDILREIQRMKIPYILVPRVEFTEGAQKKSRFKKIIANKLIFKKFANNATCIQYLTQKEEEDSRKFINNRYIIIPNGIEKREKINKSFNNKKIKCSIIGRLEPYQKGLDLLLDACNLIKEQLIEANFILNIYGPDKNNIKNSLELKIKKYGLEKIIFLNNAVFGEEKEKVLAETDVFIMTSRFEGHPMALIEALSFGIPCLVTEGTNMMKEIYESDSGWIAQNSIDSIAKAFIQMINDRNKFEIKSNKAYELSLKYDWDSLAKIAHNEYKNLLINLN